MTERIEAVRAALEPAIASLGLELFDVTFTGQGRTRVLSVAVDRDGGVDLDAITDATEAVSAVLDRDDDLVPGPYSLEVGSPGVERPLRRPAHFRRAVGQTVTVKARDADGAARRVRGVLTTADDQGDGGLTLETEGREEHIRYDAIDGARTVFEWGPAPKPGRGGKKKGHGVTASGPHEGGRTQRSRADDAAPARQARPEAAEERQPR